MLSMRKPLPKLSHVYDNAIVSRDTLRTSDLLQAFAEALDEAHPNDNDAAYALSLLANYGQFGWNTDLYIHLCELDYRPNDAYAVVWDVHNLVYNVLPDRLNEVAPIGYAFGISPNDPKLIGFFPTA
jgi:hypothetical protein